MKSKEVEWSYYNKSSIDAQLLEEYVKGEYRIVVVPQHVPLWKLIKGNNGNTKTFPMSPQEAVARAVVANRRESDFAFLVLIQIDTIVECASYMSCKGYCTEKSSVEFHLLDDYVAIINGVVEEIKERSLEYVLYLTSGKHSLSILEFIKRNFNCCVEYKKNWRDYLREGCDVQFRIYTKQQRNIWFRDIVGYELWLQFESNEYIVYEEKLLCKDQLLPVIRNFEWPKIKIDKDIISSYGSVIGIIATSAFSIFKTWGFSNDNNRYVPIDELYRVTGVNLLVKSSFYGEEFSCDISDIVIENGKLQNNINLVIGSTGKDIKIEKNK